MISGQLLLLKSQSVVMTQTKDDFKKPHRKRRTDKEKSKLKIKKKLAK